ncbi:MAG: hypothetical protein ACO4CS_17740 [bacterium]
MELLVTCKNRQTRRFLEKITREISKMLGISNMKPALWVSVEANSNGTEGSCIDMRSVSDTMVVTLRTGLSQERMGIALAHELVHVRQYVRGFLKAAPRGANVWMGKKFPAKTPYLYQPWEVQAFEKQELLFRRALDTLIKEGI